MSDLWTADELAAAREDVRDLILGPASDPLASGGDQATIVRFDAASVVCDGGATLAPDGSITFNDLSASYSTIYTGPARFIPLLFRRDRGEVAGEQLIRVRDYRIFIPFDPTVPAIILDDVITFTASDDPYIISRPLTITDVQAQSETVERRIIAKDLAPT